MKISVIRLVQLMVLGSALVSAASLADDPNEVMRGRFARKLIDNLFRMPVENERSIEQNIKNTIIHGTALTKGEIFLELVPAEHNAVLNITVEADTNSFSVGRNIPRRDITVNIHSTSHTHIHAEKSIIVYPDHISMREAIASARTELTYTGLDIDATGFFHNLKERIAHREAANRLRAEKPNQEAEVSRTAANEMRKILDERITPNMFSKLNVTFGRDFYRPLFASGRVPGSFHLATLPLSLSAVIDSDHDIGDDARLKRPEFSSDAVIAFRLHDSFPTALLGKRLQNRSMDEEDMEEFLILHGIPAGLAHYRAGDEQIHFQFGATNPVTFAFQNDLLEIALHPEHATLAGRDFGALNASAQYEITPGDDQDIVLRRKSLDTLPDPEVQNRLSRLLPASISLEKITLSDALDLKGHLEMMTTRSADGWLLLEWRLVK